MELQRPLSGSEMVELLPHTLVLTYNELPNYTDIEDLLGESRQFVIMYMTADRSGHWCCVFVSESRPDTLQFFCSYGSPIDSKRIFQFVDMEVMIRQNQLYNFLSELMINSRYPHITYNNLRLQGRNVATCGRYVTLRLWLKNLDNTEFYRVLKYSKHTPDELVTLLTENYFKGIPLSPLVLMV